MARNIQEVLEQVDKDFNFLSTVAEQKAVADSISAEVRKVIRQYDTFSVTCGDSAEQVSDLTGMPVSELHALSRMVSDIATKLAPKEDLVTWSQDEVDLAVSRLSGSRALMDDEQLAIYDDMISTITKSARTRKSGTTAPRIAGRPLTVQVYTELITANDGSTKPNIGTRSGNTASSISNLVSMVSEYFTVAKGDALRQTFKACATTAVNGTPTECDVTVSDESGEYALTVYFVPSEEITPEEDETNEEE